MNDRALTLFCAVWGPHFHDLLEQYTLPSLMLDGNLPALGLDKIYVDVMGVHHEWEHTQRLFREQCPGLPIEMRQIGMIRADRDIADGLRQSMYACRERQTRMLLCPPDTIFGPRSISNIFNYAKGKNVVVAAAHVRNNEDAFKENYPHWKLWPANRDFVRNSFAIGALNICDTNEDNCTHIGGVAWTRVNPDTRLMLHYLPTPYLCWFEPSDLDWWTHNLKFGLWDHVWPEKLIAERRLRVIGSTDTFFAIELEAASRSVALQPSPGTKGNELYNQRRCHMDACGSFLIEVHE